MTAVFASNLLMLISKLSLAGIKAYPMTAICSSLEVFDLMRRGWEGRKEVYSTRSAFESMEKFVGYYGAE